MSVCDLGCNDRLLCAPCPPGCLLICSLPSWLPAHLLPPLLAACCSCPAADGSACFEKLRGEVPLTDDNGKPLTGRQLAPLLSASFVSQRLVAWGYCRAVWEGNSPSWDELRWWPLFPQADRG